MFCACIWFRCFLTHSCIMLVMSAAYCCINPIWCHRTSTSCHSSPRWFRKLWLKIRIGQHLVILGTESKQTCPSGQNIYLVFSPLCSLQTDLRSETSKYSFLNQFNSSAWTLQLFCSRYTCGSVNNCNCVKFSNVRCQHCVCDAVYGDKIHFREWTCK